MGVRPTTLLALAGVAALSASIAVALLFAGRSPARYAAPGPDPVLRDWPGWPYRATCGYMGFDPVRVFSGPAEAERGDGAPESALRRLLGEERPFPLDRQGWRLAARRNGRALFLHGRLGAEFETPDQLEAYELDRSEGSWQMRTFSGFCNMFTTAPGRQSSGWWLAPKQPSLEPDTRRLHVITGARCSKRERPPRVTPEFVEIGAKLVMTLWLQYDPRPARGIAEICDPWLKPWPPTTIDLPEPLGDRQLYDGGFFPPVAAQRYKTPDVIPL